MFEDTAIDMVLLAHGLSVEARNHEAVAMCRWDGDTWIQPEAWTLDDGDREAIQYLLALREINRAALRVVSTSDYLRATCRAQSEAHREAHVAGAALREALSRRKYVPDLPDTPLSVGDVVVVARKNKDRTTSFDAIRGTPIPDGIDQQ